MGSIALARRDETFNLQRDLAFQGVLWSDGLHSSESKRAIVLLLWLTRHLRARFRLLLAQNGMIIFHA